MTGDPSTPCGRGILHRDTYPPYFSKFVLAHEIGHHFGLAHAGHDGLQNIMFATSTQDWLDSGLWKLWSQGEPDFQPEDVARLGGSSCTSCRTSSVAEPSRWAQRITRYTWSEP
ncbi:MAG: hypothetical protein M3454_10960 [Actinomycetota bacterium]|nr:hypothetical protein [Actinomycetota bacterium]